MAKSIMISPKKAKANAKAAEIELCWKQREEQIRKYQSRNPFSMREWIEAAKCGWLRQHGLNYWSFPSPCTHYRKLWEMSSDVWFASWRGESKRKQREFLKDLRSK